MSSNVMRPSGACSGQCVGRRNLTGGVHEMDVDALVRLGADKGCFVSRDHVAAFIEVAAFASSKELTSEELETVAGGGLI
jgi:hypothetical protein